MAHFLCDCLYRLSIPFHHVQMGYSGHLFAKNFASIMSITMIKYDSGQFEEPPEDWYEKVGAQVAPLLSAEQVQQLTKLHQATSKVVTRLRSKDKQVTNMVEEATASLQSDLGSLKSRQGPQMFGSSTGDQAETQFEVLVGLSGTAETMSFLFRLQSMVLLQILNWRQLAQMYVASFPYYAR